MMLAMYKDQAGVAMFWIAILMIALVGLCHLLRRFL